MCLRRLLGVSLETLVFVPSDKALCLYYIESHIAEEEVHQAAHPVVNPALDSTSVLWSSLASEEPELLDGGHPTDPELPPAPRVTVEGINRRRCLDGIAAHVTTGKG